MGHGFQLQVQEVGLLVQVHLILVLQEQVLGRVDPSPMLEQRSLLVQQVLLV